MKTNQRIIPTYVYTKTLRYNESQNNKKKSFSSRFEILKREDEWLLKKIFNLFEFTVTSLLVGPSRFCQLWTQTPTIVMERYRARCASQFRRFSALTRHRFGHSKWYCVSSGVAFQCWTRFTSLHEGRFSNEFLQTALMVNVAAKNAFHIHVVVVVENDFVRIVGQTFSHANRTHFDAKIVGGFNEKGECLVQRRLLDEWRRSFRWIQWRFDTFAGNFFCLTV